MRRFNRHPICHAMVLACLTVPAIYSDQTLAASYLWQGGTNWSNGSSWNTGTAPVSASDTSLLFSAGFAIPDGSVLINNLGNFTLNWIWLEYTDAGAIAFSLQGDGLTFAGSNAQISAGGLYSVIDLTIGQTVTLNSDLTVYLGYPERRLSFNQGVHGSGGITVAMGRVILQGNGLNDYQGDTVINSNGQLWASAAGTGNQLSSNSRHIVDGVLNLLRGDNVIGSLEGTGQLRFAGGNLSVGALNTSTTFGGRVSGDSSSGRLTKVGTGTLTLTGHLTPPGGITISDGTLQVGDGGTSGSVGGNIVNDSQLAFNRADDSSYGGIISGSGSVEKLGDGALTLTGNHTYSGPTALNAGTLIVNGQLLSSITAASDTTLKGNGTVGGVTMLSGSVHAPGNSIDTQIINGDYHLNGGSLEIEVDEFGNADQLVVNGSVTLTNAGLRIVGLTTSDFDTDELFQHLIIDNDGIDPVSGSFTTIDNQLAFYSASVDYNGGDGNDVILSLQRNPNDFATVALTYNQQQVAGALDQYTSSQATHLLNQIVGLTSSDVLAAYNLLSGDIHALAPQISLQMARQFHDQVSNRLAVGQGYGTAAAVGAAANEETPDRNLWLQALGGRGDLDGDHNAADSDYDWQGTLLGYDTAVSANTRVGVAVGYANNDYDQDTRNAQLDTETLLAGLYAQHHLAQWRLSGQLGWQQFDTESRRHIAVGSYSETANADYTDRAWSLNLEAARRFAVSEQLALEPYVALTGQRLSLSSFHERGAGAANLNREHDSEWQGFSSLGLRLSSMLKLNKSHTLSPRLQLGWGHQIGDLDNSVNLHFNGTPTFNVQGSESDRDWLTTSLGMEWGAANWRTYLDYQAVLSAARNESAVTFGLSLVF